MFKLNGDKKNKPAILLLAFFILSSVFTVFPGKQREIFEIIADSSLSVYMANVYIAEEEIENSFYFINDIGYGALAGYELGGIVLYSGITGVLDAYSSIFQKVFSLDFSNRNFSFEDSFLEYTADVSSGSKVFNDYLEEKQKSFVNYIVNIFDSVKEIATRNFQKVLGGGSYVSANVSSALENSVVESQKVTTNFSSKFLNNIKNNFKVIGDEFSSFYSTINKGTKNLFTLDIPKRNGDVSFFNLANVFSVEKEVLDDISCKFKNLIGSICLKDISENEEEFLSKAEEEVFNLANVSSSILNKGLSNKTGDTNIFYNYGSSEVDKKYVDNLFGSLRSELINLFTNNIIVERSGGVTREELDKELDTVYDSIGRSVGGSVRSVSDSITNVTNGTAAFSGTSLTTSGVININGTATSTFSGPVSATAFYGDGSNLTGVDSLPDQTGNSGKFLTTDGTDSSWAAIPDGVTSLSQLDDVVSAATTTRNVLVANGTTGFVSRTLTEADISDLGSYVPYTGATTNLDLGSNNLTTTGTTTTGILVSDNFSSSDGYVKAEYSIQDYTWSVNDNYVFNIGSSGTSFLTNINVDGIITATGGNSTNWNTAYGWGDHSTEGYLVNSNNLSDITSTSTARTNLGLGSLAELSDLSTFDSDDLAQGSTNLYSQWGTNGSNVYYNGGNVGIGTSTPSTKLDILSITGAQQRWSYDGTNYAEATADLNGDFKIKATGNVKLATSDGGVAFETFGTSGDFYLGNRHLSLSAGQPDYDGSSAIWQFNNNSGSGWTVLEGTTDKGLALGTFQTRDLSFWTNRIERVRIDSDGNIGIGTTTPAYKLDIYQASPTADQILFNVGTSGNSSRFSVDEDGDVVIGGNLFFDGQIYGGIKKDSTGHLYVGSPYGVKFEQISSLGAGAGSTVFDFDVYSDRGIGADQNFMRITYSGRTGNDGTTGLLINQDVPFGSPQGSLFKAQTAGDTKFLIKHSGEVGIGTTTPSEALTVSGNILATGSGTFGSTYQAVLGDDGGSRAGYFTDGSNVLYVLDSSYDLTDNTNWYIDSGGFGSYFSDNFGNSVYLTDGVHGVNANGGGIVSTDGNYTAELTTAGSLAGGYFDDGPSGNNVYLADGFYSINAYGPSYIDASDHSDISLSVFGQVNYPVGYFSNLNTSGNMQVVLADEFSSAGLGAGAGVFTDGVNTVQLSTGSYAGIFTGNVGIGTSTPATNLHVVRSDDGAPVRFEDASGYCEIDPTSTTWTCTSDIKLKDNITSLNNEEILTKLNQLNPVTFTWKSDSNNTERMGLIAQEVEEIFPDLVNTDKQTGLKSVAYGSFTTYLISAVQEISRKVMGFAERFQTKELCLEDVCITKEDLVEILSERNVANTTSSSSGSSSTTSGGSSASQNTDDAASDTSATSTEEVAETSDSTVSEDSSNTQEETEVLEEPTVIEEPIEEVIEVVEETAPEPEPTPEPEIVE